MGCVCAGFDAEKEFCVVLAVYFDEGEAGNPPLLVTVDGHHDVGLNVGVVGTPEAGSMVQMEARMEPHAAPQSVGTSTWVASRAAAGMGACVAIAGSCLRHHEQAQEVLVASPRLVVVRQVSF